MVASTVRRSSHRSPQVRELAMLPASGPRIVLSQAAKHVSEGGRILAFSSSVLAKSFPGYGSYCASKGGVEALVHVLANELRGRNITVNAVAPGPTGTELFVKGKSQEFIEQLAKMPPLGGSVPRKTSAMRFHFWLAPRAVG